MKYLSRYKLFESNSDFLLTEEDILDSVIDYTDNGYVVDKYFQINDYGTTINGVGVSAKLHRLEISRNIIYSDFSYDNGIIDGEVLSNVYGFEDLNLLKGKSRKNYYEIKSEVKEQASEVAKNIKKQMEKYLSLNKNVKTQITAIAEAYVNPQEIDIYFTILVYEI